MDYEILSDLVAFRFQTGSIKSPQPQQLDMFDLCFDSKLVRLKVKTSISQVKIRKGFDSKLVRLKVLYPA